MMILIKASTSWQNVQQIYMEIGKGWLGAFFCVFKLLWFSTISRLLNALNWILKWLHNFSISLTHQKIACVECSHTSHSRCYLKYRQYADTQIIQPAKLYVYTHDLNNVEIYFKNCLLSLEKEHLLVFSWPFFREYVMIHGPDYIEP